MSVTCESSWFLLPSVSPVVSSLSSEVQARRIATVKAEAVGIGPGLSAEVCPVDNPPGLVRLKALAIANFACDSAALDAAQMDF